MRQFVVIEQFQERDDYVVRYVLRNIQPVPVPHTYPDSSYTHGNDHQVYNSDHPGFNHSHPCTTSHQPFHSHITNATNILTDTSSAMQQHYMNDQNITLHNNNNLAPDPSWKHQTQHADYHSIISHADIHPKPHAQSQTQIHSHNPVPASPLHTHGLHMPSSMGLNGEDIVSKTRDTISQSSFGIETIPASTDASHYAYPYGGKSELPESTRVTGNANIVPTVSPAHPTNSSSAIPCGNSAGLQRIVDVPTASGGLHHLSVSTTAETALVNPTSKTLGITKKREGMISGPTSFKHSAEASKSLVHDGAVSSSRDILTASHTRKEVSEMSARVSMPSSSHDPSDERAQKFTVNDSQPTHSRDLSVPVRGSESVSAPTGISEKSNTIRGVATTAMDVGTATGRDVPISRRVGQTPRLTTVAHESGSRVIGIERAGNTSSTSAGRRGDRQSVGVTDGTGQGLRGTVTTLEGSESSAPGGTITPPAVFLKTVSGSRDRSVRVQLPTLNVPNVISRNEAQKLETRNQGTMVEARTLLPRGDPSNVSRHIVPVKPDARENVLDVLDVIDQHVSTTRGQQTRSPKLDLRQGVIDNVGRKRSELNMDATVLSPGKDISHRSQQVTQTSTKASEDLYAGGGGHPAHVPNSTVKSSLRPHGDGITAERLMDTANVKKIVDIPEFAAQVLCVSSKAVVGSDKRNVRSPTRIWFLVA